MKRALLPICAIVAAAAIAVPAQAAFPGQNGKIAFQGGGVDPEIYTVNPDGSGLTRLTNDEFFDGQPVWSPDGRKLAFWSGRGVNGTSDIFVMNPDGSGMTNVTNTGDRGESEPAWSPDGSKIAFMADTTSGVSLFSMNADGSGVAQLTNGPFDAQPAWSPDGTKIAYGQSPNYPFGDFDIAVINADGSGKVVIAGDTTHDYLPDWSPDGAKIVFARDVSFFATSEDLWVMNPDGSGQTQLTSTSGSDRDFGAVFSPDGTKIAFSGGSFPFSVFTINADGTGRTLVTAGDQNQGANFPDWQPIGPNQPPECGAVRATPSSLGAPNHRFVTVTLSGATDPDGDAVDLEITGVTQDEPVGARDAISTTQPNRVRLRAERSPHGDGRVYRIAFEASDGRGGTCTGYATVSVRKGNRAVDSAPPSYDSFGS